MRQTRHSPFSSRLQNKLSYIPIPKKKEKEPTRAAPQCPVPSLCMQEEAPASMQMQISSLKQGDLLPLSSKLNILIKTGAMKKQLLLLPASQHQFAPFARHLLKQRGQKIHLQVGSFLRLLLEPFDILQGKLRGSAKQKLLKPAAQPLQSIVNRSKAIPAAPFSNRLLPLTCPALS